MSIIRTFLTAGTLLATSLGASANDFQALTGTLKQVWPDKQHLGIVCDYQNEESIAHVRALAAAAGPSHRITVFHTSRQGQLEHAATLAKQRGVQAVILIPGDPVAGEGGFPASLLIAHLLHAKVPTVGTTPAAIAQRAVFAVAPSGEVLVNDHLKGIIDVILPDRATILRSQASAAIEVVATR